MKKFTSWLVLSLVAVASITMTTACSKDDDPKVPTPELKFNVINDDAVVIALEASDSLRTVYGCPAFYGAAKTAELHIAVPFSEEVWYGAAQVMYNGEDITSALVAESALEGGSSEEGKMYLDIDLKAIDFVEEANEVTIIFSDKDNAKLAALVLDVDNSMYAQSFTVVNAEEGISLYVAPCEGDYKDYIESEYSCAAWQVETKPTKLHIKLPYSEEQFYGDAMVIYNGENIAAELFDAGAIEIGSNEIAQMYMDIDLTAVNYVEGVKEVVVVFKDAQMVNLGALVFVVDNSMYEQNFTVVDTEEGMPLYVAACEGDYKDFIESEYSCAAWQVETKPAKLHVKLPYSEEIFYGDAMVLYNGEDITTDLVDAQAIEIGSNESAQMYMDIDLTAVQYVEAAKEVIVVFKDTQKVNLGALVFVVDNSAYSASFVITGEGNIPVAVVPCEGEFKDFIESEYSCEAYQASPYMGPLHIVLPYSMEEWYGDAMILYNGEDISTELFNGGYIEGGEDNGKPCLDFNIEGINWVDDAPYCIIVFKDPNKINLGALVITPQF